MHPASMMFQSSQSVADTGEGMVGDGRGSSLNAVVVGRGGSYSQGPQTWILTEITAPAPLGSWKIMPGSHPQRF